MLIKNIKILTIALVNFWISFSMFFLMPAQSLLASDGGWSGTGGGSASTFADPNPWFLGLDSIPYCLISTPGAVPNQDILKMMIKRSSNKWSDFYRRYNLNRTLGEQTRLIFIDKIDRAISLEFQPATDCVEVEKYCSPQSSESEFCYKAVQEKVLFLVGEPNQPVKDYLKVNSNLKGVSLRTAYNHSSYRTGGIVWVGKMARKEWSSYSHMLLHEMGHVVGMKHDSCWVMATDVSDYANAWDGIGELGNIESENWPYSFVIDQKIVFTDRKLPFKDSRPGFYPNKYLFFNLLDELGLDKDGSTQILGEVLSANPQSLKLKIIFNEFPSGKSLEWVGDLYEKNFGGYFPLTPSLYTKLYSPSDQNLPADLNQLPMRTVQLTSGWTSDNLQGVLTSNGKQYPVTLDRKRGMIFSMYFENSRKWLTVSTAQINLPKLVISRKTSSP